MKDKEGGVIHLIECEEVDAIFEMLVWLMSLQQNHFVQWFEFDHHRLDHREKLRRKMVEMKSIKKPKSVQVILKEFSFRLLWDIDSMKEHQAYLLSHLSLVYVKPD